MTRNTLNLWAKDAPEKNITLQNSPEVQSIIDHAISEMQKNPEITNNIKEDFSNLFEELAKNPETAKILDEKIDSIMKTQLEGIKEQHAHGEIYSEEAKALSKEIIHKAVQQRIQILLIGGDFPKPEDSL